MTIILATILVLVVGLLIWSTPGVIRIHQRHKTYARFIQTMQRVAAAFMVLNTAASELSADFMKLNAPGPEKEAKR